MSVREQALRPWPQSRMRTAFETLKASGSEGRVLTGGVVMLAGSVLVSLANFGYNIGVAHLLGPGDFSQAAASVTLLMLASCISLAYQLVTAKLIARSTVPGERAAIYQFFMRRAWLVGFGLSAVFLGASRWIAAYLRMPSPNLVVVFGLGMLFYIPLGVRRGGMQGAFAERPSARSHSRRRRSAPFPSVQVRRRALRAQPWRAALAPRRR